MSDVWEDEAVRRSEKVVREPGQLRDYPVTELSDHELMFVLADGVPVEAEAPAE